MSWHKVHNKPEDLEKETGTFFFVIARLIIFLKHHMILVKCKQR